MADLTTQRLLFLEIPSQVADIEPACFNDGVDYFLGERPDHDRNDHDKGEVARPLRGPFQPHDVVLDLDAVPKSLPL